MFVPHGEVMQREESYALIVDGRGDHSFSLSRIEEEIWTDVDGIAGPTIKGRRSAISRSPAACEPWLLSLFDEAEECYAPDPFSSRNSHYEETQEQTLK